MPSNTTIQHDAWLRELIPVGAAMEFESVVAALSAPRGCDGSYGFTVWGLSRRDAVAMMAWRKCVGHIEEQPESLAREVKKACKRFMVDTLLIEPLHGFDELDTPEWRQSLGDVDVIDMDWIDILPAGQASPGDVLANLNAPAMQLTEPLVESGRLIVPASIEDLSPTEVWIAPRGFAMRIMDQHASDALSSGYELRLSTAMVAKYLTDCGVVEQWSRNSLAKIA